MAFRRYNPLNVPESWERYWTKYPQGMTILESLFEWVSQVDAMTKTQNEVSALVETLELSMADFIDRFDPKLQAEVERTLSEWQKNGTLNIVINKAIQTQIDAMEIELDDRLNDIGVSQINKNRGLIDQSFLTPELLAQIAGTAGIHLTPTDGSVTLRQTAFSKIVSKNLVDKSEAKSGAISTATGELTESPNFQTTGFIPVTTGDVINTTTNLQSYSYYTNTKTWLTTINNALVKTFTVPDGVSYIRVTFYYTNLPTFMLSIGTLPATFEEFRRAIEGKHITDLLGDDIRDNSTPLTKLKNVTVGKNKLNHRTSSLGQYLNTGGVLSANADYSSSYFIGVKPNTTYVPTYQRVVAFYTGTFDFISDLVEPGYPQNKSFVTPANCYFIKISYKTIDSPTMQLEENTVPTQFVPFGYIQDELLIPASNVIGAAETEQNEVLNITPHTYITVGSELVIKNRNITKEKIGLNVDYNSPLGIQKEDGYHASPTSSGDTQLSVSLFEKDKLVDSKITTIHVVNKRTTPTSVLLLGDSTVDTGGTGEVTKNIKNTIGTNITLTGVRGTAPYNHEGRGGWTIADYLTKSEKSDISNPFFNPSTQKFDFVYYLQQTAQTAPNVFIIQLGINDTFNNTNYPSLLSNLDTLVNTIKVTHPTIKIALNVTIPPNESQDIFGTVYGTTQNQWRYKYNNFEWVTALIEHYTGVVDLIPTHYPINTLTGFTDGVHLTNSEYAELSKPIIGYLNSL